MLRIMHGDGYVARPLEVAITLPSTNAPVDLTGANGVFTIKRRKTDLDDEALLMTGLSIVDAEAGLAKVEISAEETTALPIGVFWSELALVDATGEPITVYQGHLEVVQDIVRAVIS